MIDSCKVFLRLGVRNQVFIDKFMVQTKVQIRIANPDQLGNFVTWNVTVVTGFKLVGTRAGVHERRGASRAKCDGKAVSSAETRSVRAGFLLPARLRPFGRGYFSFPQKKSDI